VSDNAVVDPPTFDIDLRDPPPANGVSPAVADGAEARRHWQLRLVGVGLLVVLNALDLMTTRAFLHAGLQEGNVVGAVLIEQGWIAWVKAGLLLALGLRLLRGSPRLGSTCALWCVVGIYLAVVAVNTMALRTIGVL
jgi:Domain of unknown function (DUF5658)